MSENDRRVESQILVRELRKKLTGSAGPVALYSPYLDEPDLRPLITEFLEQKNVICMPKVENNHLSMHRIKSLEDVARNSETNILEPIQSSPIDEATISSVIVPGRAFTRHGVRLGRGNGGYDRWICEQRKRNPTTKYIGVCFECQIMQEIPTETHDERLDEILTARGG